jgi:glycosyltransferase involved in cell wall biosynthesis
LDWIIKYTETSQRQLKEVNKCIALSVFDRWGEKIFEHLATSIPNIEFLGKVSHEKMPELYNKYKTFIYFPRIDEPFCRAAGEAALSGMEMMINDKIGCIHEMKRLGMNDFINKCNSSSFDFWNTITE